ncbi:MAG: sulfatase-like hydrolase/transferase [Planctomycetales bacterium]|nr:sulfatase-like hydrolase/transferase [Planctomycetales bacterium]
MSRATLLIGLCLSLVPIASGFAQDTASESRAARPRPNVVVFLADDAGWGDFSHSGNQQVSTPSIDSIARQGVSLDRFYVCPVCAPTRAEFLTGRYHPRGGVRGVSTGQERLDPTETTIADEFREAGYATGLFGKWHNGSQWPYHPLARGFDRFFGYTCGHWGEYFDAQLEDDERLVRTEGYIVDVCTDEALEFIRDHHDGPFFCYIPFTTPHSPWGVPAEYWDRFRDKPLTQVGTQSENEKQDETRCALAMLENQDHNVGRVLSLLDELELTDNTIVVYFSDNGPNGHRWTGGMKGVKATTDEGGVRSVAYLRWPGVLPAGHVVEPISGAIDLRPTLLSLTGIEQQGQLPLDGRDLSPLLLDPDADWPERLLVNSWAGRISVRSQTHRLDHQGHLFDMVGDPGQTTPIEAEQPAIAARLQAHADWYREEMFGERGVTTPGGGNAVDPRPFPVGYREFPITRLPARDAEPIGNVHRSAPAPNSSFFTGWTSTDDRIEWQVEVVTSGTYRVTVDYTCAADDVGSEVRLEFLEDSLNSKIDVAWDPPLHDNQDTLPRPRAESPLKVFRTLELGSIHLAAGDGTLRLSAVTIPGEQVMDLRRLTLELVTVDEAR